MSFFPTHSGTWKAVKPHPIRHVSMSVIEMAVLTGILLRVYRALVLSREAVGGWLFLGATFALGIAFLLGMVTLHLGNYPIRQWLWRAPAFAALEAATESLAAAALIAVAREPLGSVRATFGDWPGMVIAIFVWRVAVIVVFAAALAGVVQVVRYALLRREHRQHTFEAVHHTLEREARTK
jgi:hypothetical protein